MKLRRNFLTNSISAFVRFFGIGVIVHALVTIAQFNKGFLAVWVTGLGVFFIESNCLFVLAVLKQLIALLNLSKTRIQPSVKNEKLNFFFLHKLTIKILG